MKTENRSGQSVGFSELQGKKSWFNADFDRIRAQRASHLPKNRPKVNRIRSFRCRSVIAGLVGGEMYFRKGEAEG